MKTKSIQRWRFLVIDYWTYPRSSNLVPACHWTRTPTHRRKNEHRHLYVFKSRLTQKTFYIHGGGNGSYLPLLRTPSRHPPYSPSHYDISRVDRICTIQGDLPPTISLLHLFNGLFRRIRKQKALTPTLTFQNPPPTVWLSTPATPGRNYTSTKVSQRLTPMAGGPVGGRREPVSKPTSTLMTPAAPPSVVPRDRCGGCVARDTGHASDTGSPLWAGSAGGASRLRAGAHGAAPLTRPPTGPEG